MTSEHKRKMDRALDTAVEITEAVIRPQPLSWFAATQGLSVPTCVGVGRRMRDFWFALSIVCLIMYTSV